MGNLVLFGVFDKEAEIDRDQRFLPHWFQPGVATFITFRTADSMPREVVEKWKQEIRIWLAKNGIVLNAADLLPSVEELGLLVGESSKVNRRTADGGASGHSCGEEADGGASGHSCGEKADGGASGHVELNGVGREIVGEYFKLRNRLWHAYLDECHGACVLKRRELATIVLDSLKHFDGERYDLDSAIIMPNHVHLIAQFRSPTTCRGQCESWLHYTAYKINKQIGCSGVFWQSEPFDHLIRSAEQFLYLRKYIAQNGIAAKLPEAHYLHWQRS